MDALGKLMDIEIRYANLLHENKLSELTREDEILLENCRHKVKVDNILNRFQEYQEFEL